MKQTAELKNVYFTINSCGKIVAMGHIYNDTFKRFPDSLRVMTSPIVKAIIKGDSFYIETLNTLYKVVNFETPDGFKTLPQRIESDLTRIRLCTEEQLKHRLMLNSAGNTLKNLKHKRSTADRKSNFRAVKRLVNDIKTIRACYKDAQKGMAKMYEIKAGSKERLIAMKQIQSMMEIYNGKAN